MFRVMENKEKSIEKIDCKKCYKGARGYKDIQEPQALIKWLSVHLLNVTCVYTVIACFPRKN